MNYDLPPEFEEAVVRRIYRRAAELDWPRLSDAERTVQYQYWIDDPEIGGKLLLFIKKPEAVRVWMKDTPMKEYARAVNGVGKFAKYVDTVKFDRLALIAKVLGPGWTEVPDSQKVKPLRITVRSDEDEENERRLCWGPPRDIKHLVWRAVLDQANGDSVPWVICVVFPAVAPATKSQIASHERLAARLSLEIVCVNT
ncbi:hypothetical protein ACOBQX_16075 [Actinokineospora sp. G85]|uniref:hypothetical protein n=1 Tax=Actinokineospora sp. G85 TaxID=3406626 RepID=UPI003C713237